MHGLGNVCNLHASTGGAERQQAGVLVSLLGCLCLTQFLGRAVLGFCRPGICKPWA